MSAQSAHDFIERANTDDAVRAAARERTGKIEEIGRQYGYDFTRAEFDQAMRERKESGKDVHHKHDDPDTCVCIP